MFLFDRIMEVSMLFERPWRLVGALIFLVMGSAVACGPPGGGGETQREEIDHAAVVDALDSNVRAMARLSSDSVRFMETSDLAADTALTFGARACPNDQPNCEPGEPEIDTDLARPTDDLLGGLTDGMFQQENIVEQSDTTITYRADSEYLCEDTYCAVMDTSEGKERVCESDQNAPSQAELDASCASNIDEMRYRVRVWSPSDGNMNFRVMVGPGHHPGNVQVHQDHLLGSVNLSEIRAAAEHYDTVYGTDSASDIPSTFEGTVSTLLEKQGDEKAHLEVRVESDVSIGGGDVQFQLASPGQPIFGATADGSADRVSTTFNLDTLEANFAVEHYANESGEYVSFDHTAHLAGLTGRMIFDGAAEQFKFRDFGFGDSTSWLDINGERVLSLDVNPDSGRTFDMTVESANAEDTYDASWSPEFTANVGVNFGRLATKITEEWLMEDEFNVAVTGNNPTLRAGTTENDWGYLEVLSGSLEVSSSTPNYVRSVSQGNCLLEVADNGTQVAYYHPLESLQSDSCP